MKRSRIAFLGLAGLVATVQLAAAETSQSGRIDQLRAAQQTIAWQAQNSKGTHSEQLLTEVRKLDGLIADLEQGRSVDSREIDQALEQAQRGSF